MQGTQSTMQAASQPAETQLVPPRAAAPAWQTAAFLIVYLGLCALITVGYARATPAWQNPDEPAHYFYIAQVVENGCCPVIAAGDWDQAYLERLTGTRFAPDLLANLPAVQYEDHQPPLYYLLAAPVFAVTDGNLFTLRLLSVIFGVCTAFVALRVGLLAFPNTFTNAVPWRALLVVALIPQAAAMNAAVNNDALAFLVMALCLWAMARFVLYGRKAIPGGVWLLGGLAGVAALTKVTILFIVPLLAGAILLRRWLEAGERRKARTVLADLLRFAIPFILLSGLWWARNIATYGFPDLYGLAAHDRVVVGQPLTADFITRDGLSIHLANGVQTVWNSFWGQFGWMALPLQPGIYTAIAIVVAVALLGLLLRWAFRLYLPARDSAFMPPPAPMRFRYALWVLLAACIAAIILQLIYYNLRFVQFQGRYLFPALIPIALYLCLGLETWGLLLMRLAERLGLRSAGVLRLTYTISGLPVLALIPLNAYLIARVLPQLNP